MYHFRLSDLNNSLIQVFPLTRKVNEHILPKISRQVLEIQLSVLFLLFPIHQTSLFHVFHEMLQNKRTNPSHKANCPLDLYKQQKVSNMSPRFQLDGAGDLYLHTSLLGLDSQALGIVYKNWLCFSGLPETS